jgi:hypothetical protein
MRDRATYNEFLPELPAESEIVELLDDRDDWLSTGQIARALGVLPARRLGNGATHGSWSGLMSPGSRLAPRLRSMVRRGLLVDSWRRGDEGGGYQYRVSP